jgi:hypothetical protein
MGKCPICGWLNPPDAEACIAEGCHFPLKKEEEAVLTNWFLVDEKDHEHGSREGQGEEKCGHQAVMKYIGKSGTGERLRLFPLAEEREWHVVLSRNDLLCDNRFLACNNKIVLPQNIRQFLPNWNSLVWNEIDSGVSQKCCAVDGDIKVSMAMKKHGVKTKEQIIREFLETLE